MPPDDILKMDTALSIWSQTKKKIKQLYWPGIKEGKRREKTICLLNFNLPYQILYSRPTFLSFLLPPLIKQ